MGTAYITKRLVDSLELTSAEYFIWDEKLIGFGVRVQPAPSGAMSYVVKYRSGSGRRAPSRRVTLGRVGTITPDQARALARKLLGAVANGADPAASKAADRQAASLRELAECFLRDHAEAKRKPGTAQGYRTILEKHVVPVLGSRRAGAVTSSEIADLHLRMREHPFQANRTLAVLSAMYEFGGRRNFVPKGFNPAKRLEKYPEATRERYLTAEELSRLGDAIREAETVGICYSINEDNPNAKHAPREGSRRVSIDCYVAGALRLLVLTGARLREILHLKWAHVDFGRGLLLLPDSKSGKKTIVLNAPALEIMSSLPQIGCYVIAGHSAGSENEKPRADLNRPWSRITKHAGLHGLRIHDLRHTHASVGAGAGLGLPIIGKLLGHAHPSTTARYAHLDADPLRRASDQIGNQIAKAMGGQNTPNVAKVYTFPTRPALR
jgi:integrase